MAIKICKRKNYAISKGLFPSTGRPKQPGSTNDVVAWLSTYLAHFGLSRHGACTHSFRNRERCPVCTLVFCMTEREGRVTVIHKTACSRQLMSNAFAQAVAPFSGSNSHSVDCAGFSLFRKNAQNLKD
jgi:hypothetical protein